MLRRLEPPPLNCRWRDRDTISQRALLQTLLARGEIGSSAGSSRAMSDFKGRHFEGEIVLWAVRWYCRYGVSYRDLEQMMGERGVSVDHSTILSMGSEIRAGD